MRMNEINFFERNGSFTNDEQKKLYFQKLKFES